MKDYLTKSMVTSYRTCPRLFYYQNVEGIPTEPNMYLERGTSVHKFIETYNKKDTHGAAIAMSKIKQDNNIEHVENFLKFDTMIAQQNTSIVMSEEKFHNYKHNIRGIVDAVYSDGTNNIIIDYKTGTFKEYRIPEYRIELAFYRRLLEDKIETTHWGMLFTGNGHLWSEKIEDKVYQRSLKAIEQVKQDIADKKFDKKFSPLCASCQFNERCWK